MPWEAWALVIFFGLLMVSTILHKITGKYDSKIVAKTLVILTIAMCLVLRLGLGM